MAKESQTTPPVDPPAVDPPAKDAAAKKAPAVTSAAKKTPAAKTPATKTAAAKTSATKTSPAKATAKKATVKKAPAKKAPAKKTPAKKAVATKASAAKVTPEKKSTPAKKSARAARIPITYTPPVVVSTLPEGPACSCVPPVLDGRFPIIDVSPTVESGRRPANAAVSEVIPVEATAFREGHDALGVDVVLHRPDGTEHQRARMESIGSGLDRWRGTVSPDTEGDWTFSVVAWSDPWATWLHRAKIKVLAGIDIDLELEEGARILLRAVEALPADLRESFGIAIATLRNDELPPAVRLAAASDEVITRGLLAYPLRDHSTTCGPWPLRVERRRALYGSWYELFPRSEGATAAQPAGGDGVAVPTSGHSGTFATAATRLDAVAAMGFDVVYLPPIHPIGTAYRKGPNNTLTPAPGDPGSPWAIGAAEGGHDTIHPDLGTEADFAAFVARARDLGMEIALDLALQASPDHPWVGEHPEWFTTRADGTIAYAENPPKKYQDIYPLQFDLDPEGLYAEVLRVVRHWMARGVRIFRVDNPHTKPLWLWDRLTSEIWSTDPDVFFLAEAFTRPPMMRALAEVGFQQSYTYFTWRTDRKGLEDYFTELAGPASAYMRPNVFVNTPDILHEFLQHGGRPAFAIRAALAATLSPTWGVYAGYELFEHVAVREGSEEYLDSEKYQYRPRDWAAAEASGDTLAPYITLLNQIRRESPALQDLRSLTFHYPEGDQVIAYSKSVGDDTILVVCSLNPHDTVETTVWWDMPALGMEWDDRFIAHDLVSGETWSWSQATYARLDPHQHVAHIVRIQRP